MYSTDGISKTLDTHDTGLYEVTTHSTHPRTGNPSKGGYGPLSKNDGNTYCLDTSNTQAVELREKFNDSQNNKSMIRRLTPIETCRLQSFSDTWNEFGMMDGKKIKISDTQRYKQMGNAVSVNVVEAVARKIKALEL